MSLFRRIRRATGNPPAPEADPSAGPAEPAGGPSTAPAGEHSAAPAGADPAAPPSGEPPTAATEPVPAHAAASDFDTLVGDAPSSQRRGRLRRRLRHLRRVREVLLRDLGGLTFEMNRSGVRVEGPVLDGKLARLAMVDAELRELERRLGDHRAMTIREPGIGGTCAVCGELFGSEARFCWACGHPVAPGDGPAPHLGAWTTRAQLAAAAPAPATQVGPPVHDATWVEHPSDVTQPHTTTTEPEPGTEPLPRMDPDEAPAPRPPAPNEPATSDVGGESGSSAAQPQPPAPAPSTPADWLPDRSGGGDRTTPPDVAPGDPLAARPGKLEP